MTRHEERMLECRALARQARTAARDAELGNVVRSHERAAARWEALARLNEQFLASALARRAQSRPSG